MVALVTYKGTNTTYKDYMRNIKTQVGYNNPDHIGRATLNAFGVEWIWELVKIDNTDRIPEARLLTDQDRAWYRRPLTWFR